MYRQIREDHHVFQFIYRVTPGAPAYSCGCQNWDTPPLKFVEKVTPVTEYLPIEESLIEPGEQESSDKDFKEEATKAVKVEKVNKLLVFGGGAGVVWWIGKAYST